MATLRSSISVTDNMSPAIKSMSSAMNILIGSFEHLSTASKTPIDINSMKLARDQISKAEASINQMESEIQRANQQQQKLNNSFGQGESKTRNLLNNIKAFVGAYVSIQSAKEGMTITDQNVSNKARLEMINDGLQSQAELQEKIFNAAQRARMEYMDTVSVVAKLGMLAGEAFKNNDEMIRFSELMGKSFSLSGASTNEKQSGMYQLTQAMAAGKLQGDEFRSIMENAPMLAQAIADFTGKSKGELKEMSKDGEITADIIKGALFNAADNIEERYKKMPLTFGTMWTQIKNQAIYSLDGVMTKLNQAINTQDGQNLMAGITSSLIVFGTVLGTTLALAVKFGSIVASNWDWIGPIIWGLVSAMTALSIATGINNVITGINGGIQAFKAAQTAWATGATLAQVAATQTLTGAQVGLNMALMANPIGLVIMAVIFLIGVFYTVIGAINMFADTSISATGVIFGVFAWLGSGIGNVFIGMANIAMIVVFSIINGFAWLGNSIYNGLAVGLQGAVENFKSFGNTVLSILGKVAAVIDKLFKTNTAGFVSSLQSGLNSLTGPKTKDFVQPVTVQDKLLKGIDMNTAYNSGYDFGKGLGDKVKGAFNLDKGFDFTGMGTPEALGDLGKIANNTGGTKDNTKAMKDKLDINGEDLKYMRDLAEREAINRFTTASLKVEMTNNNNVNSNLDLDGISNYLTEKVGEALTTTAEGVYE